MKMRKRGIGRHQAVAGVCLGLMLPISIVSADSDELQKLGAQWQQWALSIPTSVNPQLDPTGENCMVGQRGALWFLAGTFGGGTATRTCSVPEGKSLFFPVVNAVNFNTPNVCGQGPGNLSIEELRAASEAFIDGVTAKSVELDGEVIQSLLHLRSPVFEIALPEENVFDAQCKAANLGNVPAGIFSPAVDDGFYVVLKPLKVGNHILHFHAENPSQNFNLDVTFELRVVRVLEGKERNEHP